MAHAQGTVSERKGRAVHQLLHTLSYGDAISGEVLALQRVLQESGVESDIYAINVHPKLKGRAKPYQELPLDTDAEIIFHFSLGSPLNDVYRQLTRATRSLLFHNLTPSFWFEGVNPRIVRDIEDGARELPEMCRISDRVLADSSYNASQLAEFGVEAEVLPLPLDEQKWQEPANPGIASLLQSDPSLHVLHVGRIAPNKKIEDVIKTFYYIHHKLEPNSKLWLPGIDIDTELYSFSLKRLVEELGLSDAVRFMGCAADSELRALYENASVYLCMSEHEGFCVPVIEAMHFGCPVVAYASTALPETLGDGGILVSEKPHPELAVLIHDIHTKPEFRAQLVEAGKNRCKAFSYQSFAENVRRLFVERASVVEPVAASGGAR